MDGISAYIFATVILLGVAACATLALRRMWSLDGLPDLSRLSESPEVKYAAMGRLFSTRDLDFLRSQPGYTPHLESEFRRKRAEVFRLYLRSMQHDFEAIHVAARMMAAQGLGGPELSARLLELPFQFKKTVWMARWQVFLFEHGWSAPTITIRPAVEAMFQLRGHVDLAAVASAA
jgi:hypothetical protein